MRSSRLLLLALLLTPTLAFAQHALENPPHNSNQSGVTAITGWICVGINPAVRFNGGAPVPVAYGTTRLDTAGVCRDDGNNGFSLLWNWNLLGDGTHLVELLNNGQVIASATVRVATFGTEFLRGASGIMSGTIAGRQVMVQWSEAAQNFIIVSTGGQKLTDLALLFGTWQFNYTILSTFTATCEFTRIDTTVASYPVLFGIDLQDRGEIAVARIHDVDPNSTLTRTFILADPGSVICRSFIFDLTSPFSVEGEYMQFDPTCSTPTTGNIYSMTGIKLLNQAAISQRETAMSEIQEAQQFKASTAGEADTLEEMRRLTLHVAHIIGN